MVKASDYNAGDPGLIPGLGRSPGEGNGSPLQYSCLENSWTEEPGSLQAMGLQRIGHDWMTSLSLSALNTQRKFTFEKLKDQRKSWISGVQELTLLMALNCKHHISCLRSFQITFYTNHFWKYQLGTCVIWLKVTSKILLYVWPSDQDFCDRQSLGTCFDTHGRANLKVYGGNTSRAPVDQWKMGGLLGWFPLDSFLRS